MVVGNLSEGRETICCRCEPDFEMKPGLDRESTPLRPYFYTGKIKGERGMASKGEGPQENLQKVRVLRILTGVGVVPSRVLWGVIRT